MLKLSREIYDQIRRHGESTYPYECCGALLGSNGEGDAREVLLAIPTQNVCIGSPQYRYQIAPEDLIHLQITAREKGMEILGFYHSHPDHPAHWSKTDLAEAHWIGCSYLITSVIRSGAEQTNSFLLQGPEAQKSFQEEEIEVLEESSWKQQ